ncbi:CTR2 short splice variant [Moelleriella libera RCEF 2490]|uniref:Copper transport protein n=1 Tax=Moelleriella libera RCEF 2490 TaxID=1081109 RepID=A0A166UPC0_9HYPO|nr:CTR2 short splice variant [Moelleriella libera RCEF 2490]
MDHAAHAAMGHGDMDHGGHGGMDDMCSMSSAGDGKMLFTWDTKNLCIVFRQWHIRSTAGLVFSLIAVVFLAMGYEALRALSRSYEASINKRVLSVPRQSQGQVSKRGHVVKSVFYGLQNFYAFMLM